MSMLNDIVLGGKRQHRRINQNAIEVSKYVRRFPCGRWSFFGLGLKKTWHKTCSDEPNREWDRIAGMIILQLTTESGHPVFRASNAWERGELDSKEQGKKSTQFDENEGNIKMLLLTVISVYLLSIYGAVADWCENWDKNSSEDSADDPSEDSESSVTLFAKEILVMRRLNREVYVMPENARWSLGETQQSLRPIRPRHQQRQRQNQQFEGGENFDYHVDRKIGWRYFKEPRRNPQAASSSSTSQWLTMANELELMAAHII